MSNPEIKEIELSIEQAREFKRTAEALDRLSKNKDFQHVIQQVYFKDEATRLVEVMAAPQLQEEKYQVAIRRSMEGIGQLQQFFNKVMHQGEMAKESIEEGQRELDEIAKEELGGEA